MLDTIGKVVAKARKKLRLNVQELAERASVEHERLVALEKGQPGITTTELGRVAEQLELDAAALLSGRELVRPRTTIFLKHQGAQDFDFSVEPILDDALEAGRSLRFLNEKLHCAPVPRIWDRSKLSKAGPKAALRGYALADELRRHLNLPKEPLPDLGELLEERFEIVVLVATLSSAKMTAISIRDPEGAAAVVLNAKDPQRASNPLLDRVYLAHELAHVLFDASDGGLHIVVERGEGKTVDRAEQRAKAFAAELLMPIAGLRALLGAPTSTQSKPQGRKLVAQVRAHFGTPWEIATNHLNHRGFISDEVREALWNAMEKGPAIAGFTTRLPPLERSSVALSDRIERANREGLITDGQSRVALKLPVDEPLPWDEALTA